MGQFQPLQTGQLQPFLMDQFKPSLLGQFYRVFQLLAALRKNLGNVFASCKQVGCNRRLHYDYMHSDPDYATEYETIKENAIDFVESKLVQNINNNDNTCIIFYLKTQAKHRGYCERQELTAKDGAPLHENSELANLPLDKLKAIQEIIKK